MSTISSRPVFYNSFQIWADRYARAFGFQVESCGNWVTLHKGGHDFEIMSAQGVQDICANAAWIEVHS